MGTRRACIASEARNSRTLDRSTARPSPPRQNGVAPPPLSCSSHRSPAAVSTSATLSARPSPYPLPVPNGQLLVYRRPMMLSAYGVAHASSGAARSWSPEKKAAKAAEAAASPESPSARATAGEWATSRGSGSGVGRSRT